VVNALAHAGWDLLRAVDVFPEKTKDASHFERASALGRVLVSNDRDMLDLAYRRLEQGRSFRGLVWWHRNRYREMSPGDFLREFEALAARQQDPFSAYPVIIITTPPR
jgi:hypothetical protein